MHSNHTNTTNFKEFIALNPIEATDTLVTATWQNRLDILDYFQQNKIPFSIKDYQEKKGYSFYDLLISGSGTGQWRSLEKLFSYKYFTDQIDIHFYADYALKIACENGHPECVKILLKHGAFVNGALDKNGAINNYNQMEHWIYGRPLKETLASNKHNQILETLSLLIQYDVNLGVYDYVYTVFFYKQKLNLKINILSVFPENNLTELLSNIELYKVKYEIPQDIELELLKDIHKGLLRFKLEDDLTIKNSIYQAKKI